MKNLSTPAFELRRCVGTELRYYGRHGGATEGMFVVVSCVDNNELKVIATVGGGWDHVSVSRGDRCPTWEEMEQVAEMFFEVHEYAMQLHVPRSNHINNHPFVLHWWRPTGVIQIPLPPKEFV